MPHFPASILRFICFLALCIPQTLSALTFTQFYRPSILRKRAWTPQADWDTSLEVYAGRGSSDKGWNSGRHDTSAVGMWGPIDVNHLFDNVANVTPDCKPISYCFWQSIQNRCCNELYRFTGGKTEVTEIDGIFQQNLMWGFYFAAYIPAIDIKVGTIGLEQIPQFDCNGNEIPCVSDFPCLINDILKEFNIAPIDCSRDRQGLGDVELSLGWQGYSNTMFSSLFCDMVGSVEAAVIIPSSKRLNNDLLFDYPLGYGDYLVGFGFRAAAEMFFQYFPWLGVGGWTAADIFQRHDTYLRLPTSLEQSGPLFLERGRAQLKYGSIWQAAGYIKIAPMSQLFWVSSGLCYEERQKTTVIVRDRCVLKEFLDHQERCCVVNPLNANIIAAEADERFKSWSRISVTFEAALDTAGFWESRFMPFVHFFYVLPVSGKRIVQTDMIGGSGGLSLAWKF